MTIANMLILAAALSMDAFAVAVGIGCGLPRVKGEHYGRVAGAFGLFQGVMPLLGGVLGERARPVVERWDHWIAFAVLVWIGISMIREGLETTEKCALGGDVATRGRTLLLLAVATSIDALAVGFSFSMLGGLSLGSFSCLVGLVCALLTALGLGLGHHLGRATRLGQRMEALGGLVLIAIGITILYDHGVVPFPV